MEGDRISLLKDFKNPFKTNKQTITTMAVLRKMESEISLEEKREIAAKLRVYVDNVCNGSNNLASKKLRNVNGAYLGYVLNGEAAGKWDVLSDDAWRNIQKQVGSYDGEWNLVMTTAMELLLGFYSDARKYGNVFGLVGNAGMGKTATISDDATPNTYLVKCNEYFNRKSFLHELLRVMGRSDYGTSLQAMMDEVITTLQKQAHPLIVLDEADKLSDSVLYFFISLYNALEGKCGFVIQGAPYLAKRIENGAERNRKGYKEILSRIGGKFSTLPALTEDDVKAVVYANGVSNPVLVNKILNEALETGTKSQPRYDLRRVKRCVHKQLRGGGEI
jgi:hypothetical protein